MIEAKKRMRVNNLTARDIDESFSIRPALEIMAAKMACDLRPTSSLAELEKTLKLMQTSEDKPETYLKANRHYHFTIYSLLAFHFDHRNKSIQKEKMRILMDTDHPGLKTPF